MKVWEVTSLGSHDDNIASEGLYATLEKAKASIPEDVWHDRRRWFAEITHDSGYDSVGEWWISFTHYYIEEREVL